MTSFIGQTAYGSCLLQVGPSSKARLCFSFSPHCSLLGDFFVFVLMGIIGEYAGDARQSIMLILAVVFAVGMTSFLYSKWIEQGGIRQGAELVRKMIDVDINPRYTNSAYKIKWTVSRAGLIRTTRFDTVMHISRAAAD